MTIHLPSIVYGALAVAIVYTFFPALAVKPSNGLRKAWAAIQKFGRKYGIGTHKAGE